MSKINIFNEIEKELKICGILKCTARFSCFSDNVFTYSLEEKKEGVLHQFCIIADDDFLREEKPLDLLNKKRIGFFEHTIFLKHKDAWVRQDGKCYRPLNEFSPN